MFKRNNDPDELPVEPAPVRHSPVPTTSERAPAAIGPTIRIRGDLSGEEDLLIQGEVEGTLSLPQNQVRIGKEGRVNATVNARVVEVEGGVEGDLNGEEQVLLRRSAKVQGNIRAPRVTLEDGCHFKGSIDMDVPSTTREQGAKVAEIKPTKESTSPDPRASHS